MVAPGECARAADIIGSWTAGVKDEGGKIEKKPAEKKDARP
jgi:hypothetical protein